MHGKTNAASEVVSAADFVRHFAQSRKSAETGPVFVTNHGRTTHVLVGIDEFERMQRVASDISAADEQRIADEMLRNLGNWTSEALIICDSELVVRFANFIAEAICRTPAAAMLGKPLTKALPSIEDSLIEVHIRRTQSGNEPTSADLRSPFSEGNWLQVRTFPWRNRLVLAFRDITDEVTSQRISDLKGSLLDAMNIHGEIGYLRLSIRGAIERVDEPLCEMIGLPEPRLAGVQFADLVTKTDRARYRETLEAVLSGTKPQRLRMSLMSNAGDIFPVTAAIMRLEGAYGTEGAIIVLTKDDTKSK